MKKTLTVTLLLTLTLALTACGGDKEETPEPVLCDCAQTYGEYTHLDEGETCPCEGEDCKSCTLKVNATTFNGTTKVWKETGVSVDDFNTAVEQFNRLNWSTLNSNEKTVLNNAITEIQVTKAGTGIVLNGKVLWVGCDVDADTFIDYLFDEIMYK